MLSNLIGKLGAKFPSSTLGYFLLIISHLDDTFLGIHDLEGSQVEGKQLQPKDKKRRKRKRKKL